jgi:putative transposase
VKFSFIARHRVIWAVDWMCGALGVSRGGFYAWLTRPRSERSRADEEIAAKVRESFLGSDRTYGARRIWRDLAADGVVCGLHRVERSMRLQALKARPRRRRLPPDLGERQAAAVAPNVLDRGFAAPAPNRKWIADFTYVWTAGGRLVDEHRHDSAVGHRRSGDGDLAAWQARCAAASLGSWQPVHQRAIPAFDGRQRCCLLDEPLWQRLGQRGDGELLLLAEDRADGAETVSNQGRGES